MSRSSGSASGPVGAVLVHGLVVSSEIPLRQGRPVLDREPDLVVRRGEPRPQPADPLAGEPVGSQQRPDGSPFYTAVRTPAGVLVRCHGVCDLDVGPGARVVVVHPDPAAPPGMLEVVLGGMGLALVLTLRGHLALHASAVERDGQVLAVVGRSGMGKSTTAALLCAQGCRMVTDDVLRVDQTRGAPVAHRGSSEVRIRPSSGLTGVAAVGRRVTADDRVALTLPEVEQDTLPVAALLVPYPDPEAARLVLERVRPVDALVVLSAFPRLVGWSDPATTAARFDQLAALARTVPVLVATMPWGPPFPPTLARDLLDGLDGGSADSAQSAPR